MPRTATPAAPSSRPLNIFLSSTSEDLKEHRDAVIEAIRRLGQIPIHMEIFDADPRNPLEICRQLAKSADAMVVIVGYRFGHVPNPEAAGGDGKSMVWHEVEAAAKEGKPLFCYFEEEDEKGTLTKPKEEDRERLVEFRHFLNDLKAVVYDRFSISKPDNLATRVATALAKVVFRDQARDFATALRLLDLGAHPSPPETLRTAKFLPVPLLDKVLSGSELPPEELDPLLKGEQLPAARKSLAESLDRTQKEVSALEERLAKVLAQERELSARIEFLERERPPTPPVPPTFPVERPGIFDLDRDSPRLQEQRTQRREAYEAALRLYQVEMERHREQVEDFDRRRASLRLDRMQLEGVWQTSEQTELHLTRLRQEGESERCRLEREVAAARAKDIVRLLQEMRDRALQWMEDSGTTGQGFFLLLSTAIAIPVLSRHLAGHAAEAMWADQIAQRLYGAAEEGVRRDPQALGQDGLALVMALQEGIEEGERTTAEVRRVLDSVPAEALRRFGLEQQSLLRFASPRVESFESLLDPISIAKAIERVERHRVELAGTLSAIRMLEAETAAFQQVAEETKQRAADLLRRLRSGMDSLLPRLDDCRWIWTLLARAAESPSLGGEARRFCACLRAEAKQRLEEPPEALVSRCESRAFGLPEAEAVCAEHPVTTYLIRAEELQRRRPKLEARAAELNWDGRKLAELPRRRAEEYRREFRLATLWTVVPLIGLVGALKVGALVRHFASALRSNHQDYRVLTRWSLPWLYGAALVSALGTICLGFMIPSVLVGAGPLWAAVLALSALGYLLGLALWITQTVRVLILKGERFRVERRDRKRKAGRRRLEDRWK